MINPDNPYNEKIRSILHLVQTIFKSEDKNNLIERFHIAGSKKFAEFLQNKNLLMLYEENKEKIKNILQEEIFVSKQKTREMIDEYVDSEYNKIIKENTNSIANEINILNNSSNLLNSENIFINIFKRYDSVTNDEDNIQTQYVKQIDIYDINLSSFLSNINFVDHLCNICEIVHFTPLPEQKKTLFNEIRKVNKILPCNVYLPFVKDSIRNYVIANIPLTEVKILRTKNRVPYMITVECFRLDELNYNLNNKQENANIDELNLNNSNSSNDEEELNAAIKLNTDSPINSNKRKSKKSTQELELQKSQSYVDSLLNTGNPKPKRNSFDEKLCISSNYKNDDIIINNKNNLIENLNNSSTTSDFYTKLKDSSTSIKRSFRESSSNILSNIIKGSPKKKNSLPNNKLNKINSLLESDIKISQPVIIKNLLNSGKKESGSISNTNITNLKKVERRSVYEDLDYETDPEDYEKIAEVVKQNVNSVNNSNLNNLSDENLDKLKIEEGKDEEEITIKIKSGDKKHDNEKNPHINNNELEHPNASASDHLVINNLDKNDQHDLFFGEKIEEQTERLKKSSPFGFLDTYKLFKIIVKSGEDLRQEQFATQLINEFYQIFKLEKVDCWVNPYEILATGNNVGIIEVVPNAISIDQLKRKSKNITSLKNFFECYFSPVNSARYKAAMKNFISSLAGYSLVCYFLQIKDRHNANILIDDNGHIIHIDFGFMLSNAPGKGLKFEKAPFKLTQEFVDVMGGVNSKYFTKFRKLLWK
jgi:hypothetical protein